MTHKESQSIDTTHISIPYKGITYLVSLEKLAEIPAIQYHFDIYTTNDSATEVLASIIDEADKDDITCEILHVMHCYPNEFTDILAEASDLY